MAGWNSELVAALAALPEWATALAAADHARVAWVMQGVALVALVGWSRSLTRRRRALAAQGEAARETSVWRERYEREVLWRRASEAPR